MNMYYIFVCRLLPHALSCILLCKRFWCRECAAGATCFTKTAHAIFERFLSPNQAHNGCTKAYLITPMLPGQHGTCGELKNLEKSQFETLRPTSFTERCSCNLKQPFPFRTGCWVKQLYIFMYRSLLESSKLKLQFQNGCLIQTLSGQQPIQPDL